MECARTYSNILDHLNISLSNPNNTGTQTNNGLKHDLVRVKPTSHGLKEVEPLMVEKTTRITCRKCSSRVRLEFFRCLDCIEVFDLVSSPSHPVSTMNPSELQRLTLLLLVVFSLR
jgi:hypothetical protein